MPKRSQKFQLNNTTKVRRKQSSNALSTSSTGQLDNDGGKLLVEKSDMRYRKLNQNNEVERLLLYNSKELFYHVDHSDFPAFNVGIWPHENNELLTSYPSWAFSHPHPLFVANKDCANIDICFKRPMCRDHYKKSMKHTRSTYLRALKSNKNIRNCLKNGVYHSSVFDMAERKFLEPDPYFHSSYDFYFAGGNLCILPYQQSLIHSAGENLQEVFASEISVLHDHCGADFLHPVTSIKMSENSEIFEVQPLFTSNANNHESYFIARQRNLITFNKLYNNNLKTITQFRTKSTPFISFCQSERDINCFVITTMKQHIRLYDLNSNAPKLVKLFEISPNSPNISWNTVKPWRENTFIYANEKQFFMMDIRTSPEQWLSDVSICTDGLTCDHISAVQPSAFNNLFYVATNHKLRCMDIRQLKKNSLSNTDGAICGWSHQLRYAPLIMDTLRLQQNEYIALSSPIASDLHICQLSRDRNENNINLESATYLSKHTYSSPCLPYQPPTLLEAYENARFSGKCLRPEANLETRLKCCTTGMKFLMSSAPNCHSGLGLLLTSNSNGDVFGHVLSKREQKESEQRCNRQSDEVMAKFERKICKQTQRTLNYTQIKNMKGLRKVLLCKPLSAHDKYDFDAMDNECTELNPPNENIINPSNKSGRKRHLGRWQKSLSTLHSYKDALVTDLLSIWDIDVDEEKNIRLGNLDIVKTDPVVKVDNWLSQNINYNFSMVSIPPEQLSRYSEHDRSHNFDNIMTQNTTLDFENTDHSTQIFDNCVNNTPNGLGESVVVPGKVNKNKKKKYMKGF